MDLLAKFKFQRKISIDNCLSHVLTRNVKMHGTFNLSKHLRSILHPLFRFNLDVNLYPVWFQLVHAWMIQSNTAMYYCVENKSSAACDEESHVKESS